MTNVPKIQFTNTGLVLPEELDILSGVQADINAALGGNVNPALETPQGQMASSLTAIIGDTNNNFALFVNQVDPTYADGLMQDAIGRIYFLDRKPALPTTVTCTCVGAYGTVIPTGAKVNDLNKNIYQCTGGGTIPIGGSIDLTFENVENGPIACDAHTVTKIYKAVPGWDTVDNASAGVVGRNVESRADFETRRALSVAINGQHSLQSIYGEVFNVDGVVDVYCAENCTEASANYGSTTYAISAHSIYVAVSGGLAQDIAEAIWRKKSLGCDTVGSKEVTVTDTSGYSSPYPTYTVKYNIPDPLAIKCAVSIANDPNLPAGIDELIKAAIISAFIGTDGSARCRIGATIYASKFYSAVARLSPYVEIVQILIGTSSATLHSVAVGIDQAPTIQLSDITVTHV